MKSMRSKGSMSLVVLVICVLVIGITVYVLWDERVAMQVQHADAQNFTMGATSSEAARADASSGPAQNGPHAAFDLYSLSTKSESPTVTGKCAEIKGALELFIVIDGTPLVRDRLPDGSVYSTGSDHGGDLEISCDGAKGSFSTREASISLQAGRYRAALYQVENPLADDASALLLDSQAFSVEATSTQSGDFKSLKSGNAVRASDGASGYARDDDGVYTLSAEGKGAALSGVDADTFAVSVKSPIFARDKNHAYVDGVVIPNADPLLVQPLDVPYWTGAGGIVIGSKLYKEGGYFLIGTATSTFFRVCGIDASGHGTGCAPQISSVNAAGDRPTGL